MKLNKLLVVLMVGISSMHVSAQPFSFNPTPSQTIASSTVMGSAVILAPIWLPSVTVSDKLNRSALEREEDLRQKHKDAIEIKVQNKKGQTETLFLPKETYTQVNIKDGDRIDLETDDNGVLLLKDGKPTYYFILEEKAEILIHQQPLSSNSR